MMGGISDWSPTFPELPSLLRLSSSFSGLSSSVSSVFNLSCSIDLHALMELRRNTAFLPSPAPSMHHSVHGSFIGFATFSWYF